MPELYINQEPRVNAWALGLDNPFIVVSTGTIDLLDDDEFRALVSAMTASGRKILVFLSFVLIVVVVMGTIMYVVEGDLITIQRVDRVSGTPNT